MHERTDTATVVTVAVLVGLAVGAVAVGLLTTPSTDGSAQAAPEDVFPSDGAEVTTFESAEAYRSYVAEGGSSGFGGGGVTAPPRVRLDVPTGNEVMVEQAAQRDVATDDALESGADGATFTDSDDAAGGGATGDAPRHSETNVQVAGVDEPDVVKTDGEWVYYAGGALPDDVVRDRARLHPERDRTQVIDARDPAAPAPNGSVATGERLFLEDDVLVTIERDAVHGYDVSEPTAPEELWSRDLEHGVETARLADGTMYLVLSERPSGDAPCPIRPFGPRDRPAGVDDPALEDGGDAGSEASDAAGSDAAGSDAASSADEDVSTPAIPCTEVYRPADGDGGDVTYTALSLDPETGAVGDEVSFVGNGRNTVVYASQDAIYLTYEDSPSEVEARLAYLQGPGSEHLDAQARDRLEELQGYDLSEEALRVELREVVEQRVQRLPEDERRELTREFGEGYEAYVEEHKRELLRTGIVRVDVEGEALSVGETGEVPGAVNDQFSLSSRNGHLHVATTINPGPAEWENDLYTLDDDLEVADEVTGLGEGQRIYSVRYVGDRAYVVTFRQVDPFYVIDVSDPTELEQLGKLKLPGYSDYMHPLSEERVLGVGEEDGRVKVTLFDATDPEDPVVEDDVQFDDYSTAVSFTHHAFLQDERHEAFFLPGSDVGHVVSYSDGLEEVATVETEGSVRRAVYLDDYLYVLGTEELVVLDETDWSEVERVDLR